MTEFFIEYNPYLVKSIFKKNGKEINPNSRIGGRASDRLQLLLGKLNNWDGLLEEIYKVCNDTEIVIRFRGRTIDFEDLKYALNEYKGKARFELEFAEARNDNDIIKELDKIFADIKEKNLPQFNKRNERGETVFEKYEEVKNGIFDVNVIATMSSGKSTLINALLHTELLPARNEATTATICNILDNDDMEGFEAECFSKENRCIHSRKKVSKEDLERYNADEDVRYINIEGNIPAIPSDKIRLCLRDTPGPNNSRNENHRKLTHSIIKETNAVTVYVMNATQFGINDDKQLLYSISDEMKRAGKQSRDRFIFVVNKCDELDEEKGETVKILLQKVEKYLRKFGIMNPILIPTSARLALLIRKEKRGEKLTRSEKRELNVIEDFLKEPLLHFEEYAKVNAIIHETLKEKVEEYQADEDLQDLEVLIHTGVPTLEETIKEYIDKYAYPIKIKDAISDIMAILNEINMKESFYRDIIKDSAQLQEVKEQIAEAKAKSLGGKQIIRQYRDSITQFNMDEERGKKEERRRLEKDIATLSRQYKEQTCVKSEEAEKAIGFFVDSMEEYQDNFQQRLQSDMDKNIFSVGILLLEEYRKTVQQMLGAIKITKYDFGKLSAFTSFDIPDLDQITKKNEEDVYHYETKWKNNPEREGFFGRFKFWKPKQVSYTEEIYDGKFVDVATVIVEILTDYTPQHKKNIEDMYRQASQKVQEYREIFEQNLKEVEKKIQEELISLEESLKEEDTIKKRVEKNTKFVKWIEKIEKDICEILVF